MMPIMPHFVRKFLPSSRLLRSNTLIKVGEQWIVKSLDYNRRIDQIQGLDHWETAVGLSPRFLVRIAFSILSLFRIQFTIF